MRRAVRAVTAGSRRRRERKEGQPRMSSTKTVERAKKPGKKRKKKRKQSYLAELGVFGFDRYEPVIFAALVTEDPLLLIGQTGTGKTYLLNTLSEVLGLEHRHYNASLISFDDLVGFPYPRKESEEVTFLQTPATVWGAESVLIDEISRCKPEHQNRLFSLVHERRIQGIPLEKLRYRWAAMNPPMSEESAVEEYAGSEPLDPALGDRFALFVRAVDWDRLSAEEKRGVAAPDGEGKVADDGGALRRKVQEWRASFEKQVEDCPKFIVDYAVAAVTALNEADMRISPRRSRLLVRSLLAASIVTGEVTEPLFRRVLECSLPQITWGERVSSEVILATHMSAWDRVAKGHSTWLHDFMQATSLPAKLEILLDRCPDEDYGSQAISQLLATENPKRRAAFAFVTFPAAAAGKLPIGSEGVNDLGKVASPILSVEASLDWDNGWLNERDQRRKRAILSFGQVLNVLSGGRYERAAQFFAWCLVEGVELEEPKELEKEIHACVMILKDRGIA